MTSARSSSSPSSIPARSTSLRSAGALGGDRGSRAAQSLERVSRDAVCDHRHRVVGLRACGWIARDARGCVLAAFIPTRPPPDFRALVAQADAILTAEASHGGEQFRQGPSAPALRELDAIHDRLESPADRLLRNVAPRSSFFVLPIFALANAGVVIAAQAWDAHGMLMAGIICGTDDWEAGGISAGVVAGGESRGLRRSPRRIPGGSWRRGRAGGHWLHDVVVYRGPGVSGGRGFCGREDCGVCGVGVVGGDWCWDFVECAEE